MKYKYKIKEIRNTCLGEFIRQVAYLFVMFALLTVMGLVQLLYFSFSGLLYEFRDDVRKTATE